MSQPFSAIRNAAHAVIQSWSRDIPSHTYGLLRIALGLVGLLGMIGLTPVDMYWSLDGITPLSDDGPRSWLYSHGWGTAAGWAFFVALTVVFTAMTVGFRSNTAVICAFIGLVGQVHWNRLPLSSAHQVMVVLIFCLVWTDAGAVLSLDRRLGHRASGSAEGATHVAAPVDALSDRAHLRQLGPAQAVVPDVAGRVGRSLGHQPQ